MLAGRSGAGKSTLLRAGCGLVPHFHGGGIEGELEVAGMDVRSHGPAELAEVVGLVAQEPETQIISTTVRAEIELPLELRGVSTRGPVAGGRGGCARPRHRRADGSRDRHPLGRRAPAGRPGGLARHQATARPPRRADLSARPGGRRRADLIAPAPERGMGRGRAARRASAGALPGGRGSSDRPGGRGHRLRRRPGRLPHLGPGPRPSPDDSGRAAHGRDRAPGPRQRPPGPADARRARRAIARGRWAASAQTAGASIAPRAEDSLALGFRDVWVELGAGEERTEALRGVEVELAAGERVALMGSNGAGKSTLLRAAAGLVESQRGRIDAPREVAMLPQRPGDLFVHESVGEELSGRDGSEALRRFGLDDMTESDPRDLSGGERQRLALAIVVAGRDTADGDLPGALLLDEPTRGMDRARKGELAELARELSDRGAAVMIATHDVEFAATFADRVDPAGARRGGRRRNGPGAALRWLVLLERGGAHPRRRRSHGRGRRLGPGRRSGTPPRRRRSARRRRDRMSWEAGVMAMLGLTLLGGFAWYERSRPPSQIVALVAALAAISVAGRVAFSPIPNVVPTTDITLIAGFALGPAPGFAVGALSGLVSNFWLGQGPWTPWQMAGWGLTGILGAAVAVASGPEDRPFPARVDLRLHRLRLRCPARLLADGHLRRRAVARSLPGALGPRPPVQHRARRRQRRSGSGGRPRDDPDAAPLPAPVRVRLEQGCRRAERQERAGSPRGRPV